MNEAYQHLNHVFFLIIVYRFIKISINGFFCEKEEIQVSDTFDIGGADRCAFCQRSIVLQASIVGRWRLCCNFIKVKCYFVLAVGMSHGQYSSLHNNQTAVIML